jgi:hypothetical protein
VCGIELGEYLLSFHLLSSERWSRTRFDNVGEFYSTHAGVGLELPPAAAAPNWVPFRIGNHPSVEEDEGEKDMRVRCWAEWAGETGYVMEGGPRGIDGKTDSRG